METLISARTEPMQQDVQWGQIKAVNLCKNWAMGLSQSSNMQSMQVVCGHFTVESGSMQWSPFMQLWTPCESLPPTL